MSSGTPYRGRACQPLLGDAGRQALTVLVASGLLAYAGAMVIGSLRDRRREAQARAASARTTSAARRTEVDA